MLAQRDQVTTIEKGAVVADRFRLERELGRGGMGEVWVAHHLSLEVLCAIKFISDRRVSAESRARFKSEARAAAKLRGTNVVQIFDHGVWESIPYIAMELLEGESLADRLDREGHLTLEETYAIASQVAHALTKAQRAGIVHRDLKPENIFIADDGGRETVKVLDFGVAKFTSSHGEQRVSTKTGQLVGTPNYLSPEQAHGAKHIDHRSDLYALALIVFECVTGQLAFAADGLGELLRMILSDDLPRPSDLIATKTPELDSWFARAAARHADERFDSAHHMVEALRLAIGDHIPPANVQSERGARTDSASRPLRADDSALEPTMPQRVVSGAREKPVQAQEVGFCRATDGVRLAFARVGSGPLLVKVGNWLSHVEFDWDSPIWRHYLEFLSADRTLVRFDARGNGLSDWKVEHMDFEHSVADLECVMDAAGIERAPLLGLSQGAAVAAAFAARHPERVSGLVLLGGLARGWRTKGHPRLTAMFEALMSLMRNGWGQDNPAFRQMFTTTFCPGASSEQADYYNELQRKTTTPDNAARILSAVGELDVREALPKITAPTLVMHARGDAVVPISDGVELASGIAGARFVSLDSPNHVLLADEPAWDQFRHETARFLTKLCSDAS